MSKCQCPVSPLYVKKGVLYMVNIYAKLQVSAITPAELLNIPLKNGLKLKKSDIYHCKSEKNIYFCCPKK